MLSIRSEIFQSHAAKFNKIMLCLSRSFKNVISGFLQELLFSMTSAKSFFARSNFTFTLFMGSCK